MKTCYLPLVVTSLVLVSRPLAAKPPVPVIFDTDMMTDVDDVGAAAVLHALANRGEARIVAVGVCVKNPWTPLCLDVLNTYFGRGDIPLGVVRGAARNEPSKYAEAIAREFPHRLKSAADAPDVVAVYRRMLAKQPDASLVFISVGQLTNLRDLLQSPGDAASDLSGVELVEKKVRAWVCMGGAFPRGREYNLFDDAPAAAYAVKHWPTPVVFSGFEIGNEIASGAILRNEPKTSPVRRAYELYDGLHDRQSWDLTAVLYAVRGLDGGLADMWDIHRGGTLEVKADGSNQWHASPAGRHAYLVKKMPPQKVAAVLEALMIERPLHK